MPRVWKHRVSMSAFRLALATVGTALLPAMGSAQINTYLVIAGIDGGSASKPGWIDVVSWRHAMSSSKKQTACEVRVVKPLDIASLPILAAAASG